MHVFMHAVYSICTRIDKWGGGGVVCVCVGGREKEGEERRGESWGGGWELISASEYIANGLCVDCVAY